jgi:glycine cleavage system regulatory protein
MNTSLVLALVGPNTTGLVHRLAAIAANHEANWLSARMMNLAGQFAGVVHLEVPEARADALKAALREVERHGMSILITVGDPPLAHAPGDDLRLELVGTDHPRIVRDISSVLAHLGVSIERLVTDRVSGACSGELLFRASAEIRVPADVSTGKLRTALESLAQDLMIDLTLDTTGGAA